MKRALLWLRNAVISLAGLIAIFAIIVYVASETIVRKAHTDPGRPVAVPSDSQSIEKGRQIAQTRGCMGCHGAKLEGKMFIDNALLARIAAPNLTIAAGEYSSEELERIIRHGIRPNDRSVLAMPSEMYSPLSDDDTGRLIAFLRSAPAVNGQKRKVQAGPLGRVGIMLGKFNPTVVQVRRAVAMTPSFPAAGHPDASGAYIARTSCTECHGLSLTGGQGTPDLAIAAGYSRDQFVRLMRTGKALGDRELPMMSGVARRRFSNFSDGEIVALHDYLLRRAGAPVRRADWKKKSP